MSDSDPIKRYRKLGLRDSLARSYRYPCACKELSFIIRGAYNKFPKNLQSLIYQDVISAFHLLPDMQTSSAVSAAHLLVQGVEATLPKQKRNSAIVEFKQAMVVQKRRSKIRQEEKGSAQLPQDILRHIFGLLDIQSFLSAGLVCRSWNVAAGDDHLWQSQYTKVFGGELIKDKGSKEEGLAGNTFVDWKEAFKRVYIGNCWSRKMCERGYCKHCKTIVYMNNMRCPNDQDDGIGGSTTHNNQVKPLSHSQVVEYVLNGSPELISSSDSDSDSDSDDEVVISEFWALPKCLKQ